MPMFSVCVMSPAVIIYVNILFISGGCKDGIVMQGLWKKNDFVWPVMISREPLASFISLYYFFFITLKSVDQQMWK